MTDHRIKRITLELTVGDEPLARSLLARDRGTLADRLAAPIDRVCATLGGSARVDRIDRVELDLGALPFEDLDAELPRRLESALHAALLKILGDGRPASATDPAIDLLEIFARTGNLPWTADPTREEPVAAALRLALDTAPRALSDLLRTLADDPGALPRLARHCDDITRRDLIALVHDTAPDLALELHHTFAAGPDRPAQHDDRDGPTPPRTPANQDRPLADPVDPPRADRPDANLVADRSPPTQEPRPAPTATDRSLLERTATSRVTSDPTAPALANAASTPLANAAPIPLTTPVTRDDLVARTLAALRTVLADASPTDLAKTFPTDLRAALANTSPADLRAALADEPIDLEAVVGALAQALTHRTSSPAPRHPEPSPATATSPVPDDMSEAPSPAPDDAPLAAALDALAALLGPDRDDPTPGPPPAAASPVPHDMSEATSSRTPADGTDSPDATPPFDPITSPGALAGSERPEAPPPPAARALAALQALLRRRPPSAPVPGDSSIAPTSPASDAVAPKAIAPPPPVRLRASPPPRAVASARSDALARLNELYVDDAGLVLLWPFFERLFRRVGLTDDERRFIAEPARVQAVVLLELLATGDPEPAEYRLPLCKILCGVPLTGDFAPQLPLAPELHDECARLLAAVRDHVPDLGDISPDGLRAAFLRRPAALRVRDGAWLLQVERRPHDLLLDRFPWSWSWVKLAWMPDPMRVEW